MEQMGGGDGGDGCSNIADGEITYKQKRCEMMQKNFSINYLFDIYYTNSIRNFVFN